MAIFEQCLASNISVGDWRFFGDLQFFKIVQTKLRFPAKLSQNFHKIFTKFSQNYYKKKLVIFALATSGYFLERLPIFGAIFGEKMAIF